MNLLPKFPWTFTSAYDCDDRRISTPVTKYTEKTIDTVPLYGLARVKKVIMQAFPELKEFGFTDSRVRCLSVDDF